MPLNFLITYPLLGFWNKQEVQTHKEGPLKLANDHFRKHAETKRSDELGYQTTLIQVVSSSEADFTFKIVTMGI